MSVPGLDGAAPTTAGASDRRLLLDQLAGGRQGRADRAGARASALRTVRRRVADLMDELGADSRFQAGVEAVRRGWL